MKRVIQGFISKNPTNHQILNQFPFVSNNNLLEHIAKAHKAFNKNLKEDLKVRSSKVNKVGQILSQKTDDIAKLMALEMGKPVSLGCHETKQAANFCFHVSAQAENWFKTQMIKGDSKKSMIEYRPVGPIYHLTPFNVPVWLCVSGCIPKIALGNPILHRISDSTPQLGLLIESIFHEAGFSNGEFQNVFSAPDQAELILSDPRIAGLCFTGSTQAGSKLGAIAGKYIKKAVMELGGSDPFLVLKDADIDLAVEAAISSRLFNSGQACISSKRFIIHEQVYEEFKSLLLKKVRDVKIGDPLIKETAMGPLAREDLLENIEKQVSSSIEEGGKLIYGGRRVEGKEFANGNFYMPTIIEIDENNILAREETFGPVFSLFKAKSEEEQIKLANNTEYGLGSIIFSRDTDRAELVGSKIHAGMLWINDRFRIHPDIPFGGVKNSGHGRELGHAGALEFANLKMVWVK